MYIRSLSTAHRMAHYDFWYTDCPVYYVHSAFVYVPLEMTNVSHYDCQYFPYDVP